MSLLKGNKETKRKLGHILSAFIILIHALEKYDLNEPSWSFFAAAGLVFLCVALMHHHIAKVFPYVDGVFFIIEAIVYAVVAADYFSMGKKGLPWCYIFAAVAYTVAAFIRGRKGNAIHAHDNPHEGK